jgi:hypothetical protein
MLKRALACLAVGMAAGLAVADPISLAFAPRPTDSFRYRVELDVRIRMPFGDPYQTRGSFINVFQVRGVEADGMRLLASVEEPMIDMPPAIGDAALEAEVRRTLLATRMNLRVDAQGRVSETEPEGDPQGVMAELAATFVRGGHVGFLGIEYPGRPVRVGERWEVPFDIAPLVRAPLTMEIEGVSDVPQATIDVSESSPLGFRLVETFQHEGRRYARVRFAQEGRAVVEAQTVGLPGMTVDVKVFTRGQHIIDLENGFPVETESITTTLSAFPGMQMEQRIQTVSKLLDVPAPGP